MPFQLLTEKRFVTLSSTLCKYEILLPVTLKRELSILTLRWVNWGTGEWDVWSRAVLEEESAAFSSIYLLWAPHVCALPLGPILKFLIRLDLKQLDHLSPVAQLRAALCLFLCMAAASHCHGGAMGWHGTETAGLAAPVQHYNSTEGAAFCF